MRRIACVFSFDSSPWLSCQKIVKNLLNSYASIPEAAITRHDLNRPLDELAREIQASRPEVIAFTDHHPHPLPLVDVLLPLYRGAELPLLLFHVYGDFTLHYPLWKGLQQRLLGQKVLFLAASPRQKALLDGFLKPPQEARVCPFPVDPSEFHRNERQREERRRTWEVAETDHVFITSGRLSHQKRTHTLLKAFSSVLERPGHEHVHLFLHGQVDSLGDPFFCRWETEGEYFRKLHRLLESFPAPVRSRIRYMGNVPGRELNDVYQGADTLLNLSVHNDEDFGMSVAEAQMGGLCAIVTDWGGLAGFHREDLPGALSLVPVKLGQRAKLVNPMDVEEAIMKQLFTPAPSREALSRLAMDHISTHAVSLTLERILKVPAPSFNGWTPLFEEANLAAGSAFAHVTPDRKITPLYRKIYGNYVRDP